MFDAKTGRQATVNLNKTPFFDIQHRNLRDSCWWNQLWKQVAQAKHFSVPTYIRINKAKKCFDMFILGSGYVIPAKDRNVFPLYLN